MDAKHRPPRKLFFSRKGRMDADLTFLDEPDWKEVKDDKNKMREVLSGRVKDNDRNEEATLEQFAPDAYDLSEALVQGLGASVTGKRAHVKAGLGERKTSDGKSVPYIDGFTVKPL